MQNQILPVEMRQPASQFRQMIDLLSDAQVSHIDIYGRGTDQAAIAEYVQRKSVTFHFKG